MEHQTPSDGLMTREAVEKLCTVIEEEVNSGDAELESSGTVLNIIGQRPILRLHSDIVFSLYSAFSLLCCGFLLLWAAIVLPDVYVLIEAAFLILFCVLNLFLSGWNFRLKQRELIHQAKSLLKDLRDVLSSGEEWTLDDYLPLHSPHSSSVSLQWTFRDGQLVNLPQVLLVEGDIILVRPGRPLPGDACKFQDHAAVLKAGEIFLPEPADTVTDATVRVPLQQEMFILLETPYRKYLRECIQRGNSRPVTMLENRRLMGTYFIERIVTPVIVITSLLVNVIRLAVIPEDIGHWPEMLIILQVNVILSLCPLAFPLMWIVLNQYGVGRLVALFHTSRLQRIERNGEKLEFLEDQDISDRSNVVSWREILRHSWSSFTGNSCHLPRTASLLHGLGTVTSFSCVDKQGILSYPDPTIEKVFFMSNAQEGADQHGSKNSVLTEDSQLGRSEGASDWPLSSDQEDLFPQSHAEVLTVSMNADSPTGLQFDEPDWEKHLNSLKPMGLNILLNACHHETEGNYLQFLDHCLAVTSSALKQAPFCPQRRCLCQGSYLMGFSDQAASQYMIEQQIAMYKVVASERRLSSGGSLRSQSVIQRRNPLPHVLSVVVQDHFSGNYQVMTQGTAQLVLALCKDFWDGQDLLPLSDSDRKKIFDFYQRAMLSSYCSVLAYQPVMDYLPEYEDNMYIELPSGFGKHAHVIKEAESPELVRSSWDVRGNMSPQKNSSDLLKARKCRSLDSAIDSLGRLPAGEECLRAMSGQIFIGMVTTNFQPKTDILTLIDQLDQACIRFVHFSEDQVLRSKVFAEKMGLEAGWNCHISLQSPSNDVRSLSHSNSGQVSHHASQCSSAGIDQIEMDIDAQRVRFKEDSCGNVQADTVTGNEEKKRSHEVNRTEGIVNQADMQVKLEVVEDSSSDVTESSELLSGMKAVEENKQTETSEKMEVRPCDEENSPEWHPLIEGSKEGDDSNSMSLRQRQISETQTCSDGTDVDTTDSVPGGWDVSNRVFAEKMGLEAGWNCHISLQSPSNDVRSLSHSNSGQVSHHASQCSSAGIDQTEMDIDAQRVRFKEDSGGNVQADTVTGNEEKKGSHEVNRTEGIVNQADMQVKLEVVEDSSSDVTESSELLSGMKAVEENKQTEASEKMEVRPGDEENPPEWRPLIEDSKEGDDSNRMSLRQRQISETQTCSDGTDVDTTDSVPGGWDVSNRARLPRGVENIRPHIETIDNVPLQVPLFTDVTPETTKEMIQIMQENNEVVCCLGSSVNITNISIFAQADFSIGLEPLYPHICLHKDGSREEIRSINRHYLPPMELAAILTSLPCSVYFHRNDHISISAIVEEARVLCQGITNCFTFFVFAVLTISAINFVSSLFLPPPLSGRHILWLSVFVAPWLSLSLVGSPGSSEIMRWSTGKNMDKTDCKNILLLFACFLAKFGGIIAVSLVCHALTLNSLCLQMHQNTTDCHPIYGNRNYTNTWNGLMDEAASHLALSQNLIMFFITLYLVVISSSFVHPLMSLWRQTPVSNGLWCAISAVIMVLALLLLLVVTPFFLEPRDPPVQLGDIPLPVWIVGCIWPIPNLGICEAVKVLEIREYDRWQRRSKLLFDTKLGMNSPF